MIELMQILSLRCSFSLDSDRNTTIFELEFWSLGLEIGR
jgi:hypothetical protein